MPTDSLMMARIHPGHNGPPPSSNVIPEPVQNRVNGMKQFDIGRGFYNESSGIQILISIYRILNHMKKNHKVELYITLNFM